MSTESDYRTSHLPMRVVDPQFNVVSQNHDMVEMTGVRVNSREVKCHEQLSSPVCNTEDCTLKRLRDGEDDMIVSEIERELPGGETKHVSVVAEAITDETGEFDGIVESFKDISDLNHARDRQPSIAVPQPTDPESFRAALTTLMAGAAENGVEFSDRSWATEPDESGGQWDLVITTVQD